MPRVALREAVQVPGSLTFGISLGWQRVPDLYRDRQFVPTRTVEPLICEVDFDLQFSLDTRRHLVPTILKIAHDAGFTVKETPDEVRTVFINAMKSGEPMEVTAVKNDKIVRVNANHVLWFHEPAAKGGAKMVSA